MRTRFNLNEYLKNKDRKIVTRKGKEVDLFFNNEGSYVAFIAGSWWTYDDEENGVFNTDREENSMDLFFEDDIDVLSDFEKTILDTIITVKESGSFDLEDTQQVRALSAMIKETVKKELFIELDENKAEFYNEGFSDGKEFAIAHMPNWKKAERDITTTSSDFLVLVKCDGGDYPDYDVITPSNRISKGEWYLDIGDMDKLPKKE